MFKNQRLVKLMCEEGGVMHTLIATGEVTFSPEIGDICEFDSDKQIGKGPCTTSVIDVDEDTVYFVIDDENFSFKKSDVVVLRLTETTEGETLWILE